MYICGPFVVHLLYIEIMSVTINPVIREHLWKDDGTNFVRIRVTHKRKSRFIKSNIVVTKSDLTRAGDIKSLSVLNSVGDLMKKIRKVVNDIDTYDVDAMNVNEVVARIEAELKKPERFVLDFIDFGFKVASKKSTGTASTYHVALNALLRFFNNKHPDISEITVRSLRAFEEFIRNEKVVKVDWRKGTSKTIKKSKSSGRAASLYLACIRHIYKSARIEYNDPDLGLFPIPSDPFEYYSIPKAPTSKHRDIPIETIQMLIDTRKELTGRQRMSVDAFLISFGLCGMNAVDMYSCAKVKKNNILHYCRTKTKNRRDDDAEMWVKVHPCIKKIMDDYADDQLCFNFYRRYSRMDTFHTALNTELKRWANTYKQTPFTFYAARHSWATIGRSKRCNVDAKVITAGLCHVDSTVDDIYINFDWEQLWDAQKKILDVFRWE